jgi:hypothetical protein
MDCFAEPVIGRPFVRPVGSQRRKWFLAYFFTSGQRDNSSGWKASLPGMVATSL